MSDFDTIRENNPELAVNLYAMTPGGVVTLEIITPDGASFTWAGETAEAAIEAAFPSGLKCPNTGLPCVPGCNQKSCAGLHTPLNEWPTRDDPASIFTQPTPPDTGSIFD